MARSRALAALTLVLTCTIVIGLTAALGTSAVARVDRYSFEHLMPGRGTVVADVGLNSVGQPAVGLKPRDPHLARQAHFVWGPFSRLFATVFVIALSLYGYRRRRDVRAPIAWLIGYGVANLAAFAFQHLVRRPDIIVFTPHLSYRVSDYAASFPSGYSVRVVFSVLVVCALWPRLGLLAAPLALVVLAAIVAGGSHLPTDVVAGSALAVASYVIGAGVVGLGASTLRAAYGGRAKKSAPPLDLAQQ